MLEHLREMGKLATDGDDTLTRMLEGFEERSTSAKDALKSLDDELAALNASEAPEEVMGVVEANTRARIEAERKIAEEKLAQIEAEKAAAIEAAKTQASTAGEDFDSLFADVTTRSADAAAEVAAQWARAPWSDWGRPPSPSGSDGSDPTPGYATGTAGDYVPFGYETRARLHGDEAIVPRAGASSLADDIASRLAGVIGSANRGDTVVHAHLNVDRRQLAEAVVPVFFDVAKSYGVGR
jgi:hypothetical protein